MWPSQEEEEEEEEEEEGGKLQRTKRLRESIQNGVRLHGNRIKGWSSSCTIVGPNHHHMIDRSPTLPIPSSLPQTPRNPSLFYISLFLREKYSAPPSTTTALRTLPSFPLSLSLSLSARIERKEEMGLSSRLHDVSSDSIPILLVLAAAGWVSYLRSLLLCLLHSLGLLRLHPAAAAAEEDAFFSAAGSGLAGLVVIASSSRPFAYEAPPSPPPPPGEEKAACMVCLCALADGDRVRRLACCHVFHSECLDGWFDQRNLSCPLCRSPLVAEERRADADRRIGMELVAWLSPY